jgi:ADP-ribose pyrophosphatase YjhB (NUDIX family)
LSKLIAQAQLLPHLNAADENPKIVVGSVATWQKQVLLVKRSIEPRRGFWALPAGFLETGETAEAGAEREASEEAHASLKMRSLLAVYSIPHISQM